MSAIMKNWKKTVVFGLIYAVIASGVLALFSMPSTQIAYTVIVSSLIMVGIVNYIGVFKN